MKMVEGLEECNLVERGISALSPQHEVVGLSEHDIQQQPWLKIGVILRERKNAVLRLVLSSVRSRTWG